MNELTPQDRDNFPNVVQDRTAAANVVTVAVIEVTPATTDNTIEELSSVTVMNADDIDDKTALDEITTTTIDSNARIVKEPGDEIEPNANDIAVTTVLIEVSPATIDYTLFSTEDFSDEIQENADDSAVITVPMDVFPVAVEEFADVTEENAEKYDRITNTIEGSAFLTREVLDITGSTVESDSPIEETDVRKTETSTAFEDFSRRLKLRLPLIKAQLFR